MKDVNVEALNEVHDLAKRDAEAKLVKMEREVDVIREESRVLGVLQKIRYDQAHNELLKYAMFYQARTTKEYKKEGMTFEQFCEAAGENVRNVQRTLKDVKSIYDNFHDNLSCFLEVPFNKIKYLGRSFHDNLSQNGMLILGEEKIPLTPDNQEEIEAAIDAMIESHKKEKQSLKKDVARYKKKTDKVVEEETKGLRHERDALIKEVDRLKPLDVAERDISWCEEYLKEMQATCVNFETSVRKMAMDKRIHEDMHVQATCESMINMMARACRDLQREWDEEFNSDDDE